MRASLSSLALAAGLTLVAQAACAQTLAITHAHIFTVGPKGEIASGTVVISNGRIVSVASGAAIPAGAQVIDAEGQILTPGLVAADSGLGLQEVGALGGDQTVSGGEIGAAFDVSPGVDRDSTAIPVARLGGLTAAVASPAPSGGGEGQDQDEIVKETAGAGAPAGSTGRALFAGQAAVITLDAERTDPILQSRVAQVSPLGGLGAKIAGGARGADYVALKAAFEDVRWYMKNRAAYDRRQARALTLSRADLEALVPVVEGRQPLVLQADRAADIRQALKLAREEHLRVIIDGGAEAWRLADEVAAAHTPVILDPLQDLPDNFETLGSTLENAGRLSAAGVPVIIRAAEGGVHRVRETRYDAGNAVAHGMKWEAALEAVTINPARAFGVGDRIGSIEPGKAADLVLWSGDPFEPSSQPVAVIINGHRQPMTSRQIELQRRYHDLQPGYPPQYH